MAVCSLQQFVLRAVALQQSSVLSRLMRAAMNDVAQAGYKVGPVLATAIALLCLGTRLCFEGTAVDNAQKLWIRCVRKQLGSRDDG